MLSKLCNALKMLQIILHNTNLDRSNIYRMSHRVPAAFKSVYGHLNSIFLTGNFAWAFPRHFANSGQKDFAKF